MSEHLSGLAGLNMSIRECVVSVPFVLIELCHLL